MDGQAPQRPASAVQSRTAWFVGPVFLALAAWFLFGPETISIPESKTPDFPRELISIAPLRKTLGEPPAIEIGGYRKTCMECHRIFRSEPPRETNLRQHTEIRLRHGPLASCLTCHDRADRNRLVTKEGRKIPFTRSSELCAKCHQTIAADWSRGMHGKDQGSWKPGDPKMRRFQCANCHDPHEPTRPAMQPFTPLPGPHTLRLPPEPEEGSVHEKIPHGKEALDPLYRAFHGGLRGDAEKGGGK